MEIYSYQPTPSHQDKFLLNKFLSTKTLEQHHSEVVHRIHYSIFFAIYRFSNSLVDTCINYSDDCY
jgi:hypothetical protein